MKSRQRGFTLVELFIGVLILGIIALVTAQMISMALALYEGTKRAEAQVYNLRLASALKAFARNSNGGRLPTPYTGNGLFSAVYNPEDTSTTGQALAFELRNTSVPLSQINSDSSLLKNVKAYRVVQGLTYTVPLYFTTGTPVTLTYDVGTLVQTTCAQGNACNKGIPGDSVALTDANAATWDAGGSDYAAVTFSTLPDQKEMLRMTIGRINRLTDRLASEFYTRQRLSAADSANNFYPLPTNAGAPNLSGGESASFCYNGWYRLDATNVNILPQLGLDKAEFGVTAWGGPIEYCQDFDPTQAGANKAPHYAALRFNKNLTSAGTATATNSVIVTF